MTKSLNELRVIYPKKSVDKEIIWDAMNRALAKILEADDKVTLYGIERKFQDVRKYLECSVLDRFDLFTSDFELRYSDNAARAYGLAKVIELNGNAVTNWVAWMQSFYNEAPFISAWVSDIQYSNVQNMDSIRRRKLHGLSYKHYPTIKNQAPPPCEQVLLDISGNPCRYTIRDGYVEAIGCPMWVSEEFWKLTGTDKDTALKQFGEFAKMDGELVKIDMASEPFHDDSNDEDQHRLREILFGVDKHSNEVRHYMRKKKGIQLF